VPGHPIHIGACDAAKSGAGGIWFPAKGPLLLWHLPLADDIQRRLVSSSNPAGDITNSDLELAGTVLHQDILRQHAPIADETAHTFCDNTPVVFWQKKGSVTSTKAASELLLLAAILRRRHRCLHQIEHISGDNNRMADDASRKWSLSDDALLTYFNSTYPQMQPWQLCHPTKPVSSSVTSSLC
jgi:hypothetical protein